MNRSIVEALCAMQGGAALLWGLVEREESLGRELGAAVGREREAWQHEREHWQHERVAWQHERDAWQRERDAWQRERDLLATARGLELEAGRSDAEALQSKLDIALGHSTVRSVLEQVASEHSSTKSTTKALESFCDQPLFKDYLELVSEATGYSSFDLAKSAKAAYGMLSEVVHHGSTLTAPDAAGVPQAVMGNKSMLYAVSAIFKFSGRDVRFYLANSRDVLKVPSPPRSPIRSQATSGGHSASGSPSQLLLRPLESEASHATEAAVAAAATGAAATAGAAAAAGAEAAAALAGAEAAAKGAS